jgi:hypothetical protein
MKFKTDRKLFWSAIMGDVFVFVLVTIIGFSSHDTLTWDALPRMLATFIPFSVSWMIMAPWMDVFNLEIICDRRQLFRVPVAAMLAAPLAATLRGIWLNSPVLPVFVIIMAAISALIMIAWRFVLQLLMCRSL